MEYTEEEVDVLLGFETETGFRKIGSRDILYLEYRNRKVRLVTLAGEFWLRESIGAMEKRLAPYGFYMPHKSFVVNFFHVKNLKGYDITMSDGQSGAAFPEEIIRVPGRAGGLAVRTDLKEVQSGLVESFFAYAGISDIKRLPV